MSSFPPLPAYLIYAKGQVPSFTGNADDDASALRNWMNLELGNIQPAIPKRATKTVTADYTLTTDDDVVLVDATAGNRIIRFPDPTRSQHGTWTVKKIDGTANTVTFASTISATSVAATFDGATSPVLSAQYDGRTMRSDGIEYYTLTVASRGGATLTFGTHLTGGSYNGLTPVTLATDATSANTASTIVARDGSGNFAAGTITATLAGNATSATTAIPPLTLAAIGSYALLGYAGGSPGGGIAPGATALGSALQYCNIPSSGGSLGFSGTSPAGTWRCMGFIAGSTTEGTLWLRIS